MVIVTVEIPDELALRRKMSLMQLTLWVSNLVQREIEEQKKTERFREIVSKSKATEKDVEELSDEINGALAKHYSKYR